MTCRSWTTAAGLEGWPVAEQQLWWLTGMQDLLRVLIQRSKLCQLVECHTFKNTLDFIGISKNQSNSYEYGPKKPHKQTKKTPTAFKKLFHSCLTKIGLL